MALSIVIGAGTNVSFGDQDACLTSVNWSFNPGRQDAYCLGSWEANPDYVTYKPTQTLSITGYAPVHSNYSTIASTSCADANTIDASLATATCDGSVDADVDGSWFVQSYSYSKETTDQPAQETWSLIRYRNLESFLTTQGVATDRIATPSYIMRGITMGESTEATGTDTGINFSNTFARAYTGSVSAGGFGNASSIYHGTVSAVGGGTSSMAFKGTGSASIPYTPLYI